MDRLVNDQPVAIIDRDSGRLCRPEDIAFTPDGRYMAIANSADDSIGLYRRSEETNRLDADKPVMVRLEGGKHLHSLAFHPSGDLLGVTQCDGHSTLFRYSDTPCGVTPLAAIDHPRPAGEEGPKGIAFTRDGQRLCISTAQHEVRMYAVTARLHRQAAGSG